MLREDSGGGSPSCLGVGPAAEEKAFNLKGLDLGSPGNRTSLYRRVRGALSAQSNGGVASPAAWTPRSWWPEGGRSGRLGRVLLIIQT